MLTLDFIVPHWNCHNFGVNKSPPILGFHQSSSYHLFAGAACRSFPIKRSLRRKHSLKKCGLELNQYIYICVCVCVCVLFGGSKSSIWGGIE